MLIISGLTDHSGLRIWMTPTLREYDAGILETGFSVRRWLHMQIIPPHAPAFMSRGVCHGNCLTDVSVAVTCPIDFCQFFFGPGC